MTERAVYLELEVALRSSMVERRSLVILILLFLIGNLVLIKLYSRSGLKDKVK